MKIHIISGDEYRRRKRKRLDELIEHAVFRIEEKQERTEEKQKHVNPSEKQTHTISSDLDKSLYIAGAFTQAPGIKLNGYGIVKWNGKRLSKVLDGFEDNNDINSIEALAFDENNDLYIAGAFTQASGIKLNGYGIVRWDGKRLSKVLDGFNDPIEALAFDGNNNLYIGTFGGMFKYDGRQLKKVVDDEINAVEAIAIDKKSGCLYYAIGFGTLEVREHPNKEIMKGVYKVALASRNGVLYIATSDASFNNSFYGILEWDGKKLTEIVRDLDVDALAVNERGELYIARRPDDYNYSWCISKYTGKGISEVLDGFNGLISALAFKE